MKLRKNNIFIPTMDDEVKIQVGTNRLEYFMKQLRACGEPICLFGEGPADRRERLRNVLASKSFSEDDIALQREILGLQEEGKEEDDQQKEVVYSRAEPELIAARQIIFKYSIERQVTKNPPNILVAKPAWKSKEKKRRI